MKKKLTLIVTVRGNDPHLERTLTVARNTAGMPIHLMVVVDGCETPPELDCDEVVALKTPRGCMAARHAGILRSTTPAIVVTDAHMILPDGWAVQMRDAMNEHPRAVIGTQMQSVTGAGAPTLADPYTCARLRWRTIDAPNGNAAFKEYAAMGAKWATQAPGEVGCVMGAFYGMRRTWYNAMGAPWEVGTGWGTDEEVISIASYLSGGTVRMLPMTVQHVYQTGGVWKATAQDLMNIWKNRMRLIHVFPFSDDERDELAAWLGMNAVFLQIDIGADLARPCVQALKDRYADKGAALVDYVKRFVDRVEPDQRDSLAKGYAQARTPRPAPQVIHRQAEVCRECKAADSFRVQHTEGNRQYMACTCGARAVRINHGVLQYGVGRFS